MDSSSSPHYCPLAMMDKDKMMAGTEFNEAKDLDCTDYCCSVQHGRRICAIATASNGIEAISMWLRTCVNYAQVQDEFGRTALHIVASTGNLEALEWLVKRAGGHIDKRDKLSGYTPLHRSIFFGRIDAALSLIKLNADLNLRDNEGMTPLDLCNVDCPIRNECNIDSDPTELLVWGTNDNFTLGNVNQQERLVPEQVDVFRKNNILIKRAVISTYHSMFLSQSGDVFVCGSGRNGVLGNGFDKLVLQPEQLHFKSNAKCVAIAASSHHTLFLMENGRVYGCGSNEYGIIGQKETVTHSLIPRPVDIPGRVNIEGILTSRYHSVFYTAHKMFSCGLNRGQLGHSPDRGPCVFEPKLVPQSWDPEGETKFTHFATSTCATVARANTGFIYVFHKFDCIKINAKQFDVVKLQVTGGGFSDTHVDKGGRVHDDHLVLLILTSTGRVIIWRAQTDSPSPGQTGMFSRTIFNAGRVIDIADFSLNRSSLLFVTKCGEAYKSLWKPLSDPSYIQSWQARHQKEDPNDFKICTGTKRIQKGKDRSTAVLYLEYMKSQKIKHVYSALYITSDELGKNYGIIQSSPKAQLTALPLVKPSAFRQDLQKFLEETNEEDNLHDIVIIAGNRRFPAHLYIISSGCPKLYSIIVSKRKSNNHKNNDSNSHGEPELVTLPNMHEQVFQQILQFVYHYSCDLTTVGTHLPNIRLPDIYKSTTEAARSLELENLCKSLKKFTIMDDVVRFKPMFWVEKLPARKFVRRVNEDLADITVQSLDGHLFKAHKCILVARSEYFHSMLFANVWLEHSADKPIQMQFSGQCLEIFLEFIYEDNISSLPTNDFDGLSEILAMSDNLFLERLRTLVEAALADMLTLKNVPSMLYLADRCNAVDLKETCMQFICMNLPLVLETRLLDPLPVDLVKDISNYYSEIHFSMRLRRLKKCSDGPSQKELEEALDNMSSELSQEIESSQQDEEIRKPHVKSKTRARYRSRVSESEHLQHINPPSPVEEPPKLITMVTPPSASQTPPKTRVLQPVRKLNFPNPSQTLENLRKAEAKEKEKAALNPKEFPTLGGIEIETVWPKSNENQKNNTNIANNNKDNDQRRNSETNINNVKTEGKGYAQSQPKAAPTTPGRRKTKWKSVDLNNANESKPTSPTTSASAASPPTRDPANPWKIQNRPKFEFREIVQDEVEKKANFERATTKALNLMQIEDQAINQLLSRYRSLDVDEGIEIVTVERVCSNNFAPPTWVQHNMNMGKSPSK